MNYNRARKKCPPSEHSLVSTIDGDVNGRVLVYVAED